MLLMVALEADGDLQHVLLQEAALGADLVGGDGLMLEAESDVEGVDIRRHGGGARAPQTRAATMPVSKARVVPDSARRAPRVNSPRRSIAMLASGNKHSFRHDGLSPPNGCDGHAPSNRDGAPAGVHLRGRNARQRSHCEPYGATRDPDARHGLVMQGDGDPARTAQGAQRATPAD